MKNNIYKRFNANQALVLAFILFSAILTGVLSSCESDEIPPAPVITGACDTVNVSYSKNIQPYFDANCACHLSGNPGGVQLNNYAGAKQSVDGGTLVPSISPGGSMVSYMSADTCTPRQIRAWAAKGAPNN